MYRAFKSSFLIWCIQTYIARCVFVFRISSKCNDISLMFYMIWKMNKFEYFCCAEISFFFSFFWLCRPCATLSVRRLWPPNRICNQKFPFLFLALSIATTSTCILLEYRTNTVEQQSLKQKKKEVIPIFPLLYQVTMNASANQT